MKCGERRKGREKGAIRAERLTETGREQNEEEAWRQREWWRDAESERRERCCDKYCREEVGLSR